MDKTKSNRTESHNLGSSNYMVNRYFDCLRELVEYAQMPTVKRDRQERVLPCVVMGVAIVEAFINTYFRILAEESKCTACREQTLRELDENISLDRKIKIWPKRFFGKEIDFSQGIGKRFMALKMLRNKLMHFTSSYESIEISDIKIEGLSDISAYNSLDVSTTLESLSVAEGIIEEIFRLRGIQTEKVAHYMQLWAGKMPLLRASSFLWQKPNLNKLKLAKYQKGKKRRKMSFKFMFDTNIFDAILDGHINVNRLSAEDGYYVTHIQKDEIEAINDPAKLDRKQKLCQTFEEVSANEIPTESFVLNRSRIGKAKLGDGVCLDELKKGNLKHIEDALIGEAAIKNQFILVTNDPTLLRRVKSLGGEAVNFDRFMKREF